MRALSIRQPFAELILRGIKTVEYRSRPTRIIGERFWIYASRQRAKEIEPRNAKGGIWSRDLAGAADELPRWMLELAEQVRMVEPGTLLPTGVIVGSAVISECVEQGRGVGKNSGVGSQGAAVAAQIEMSGSPTPDPSPLNPVYEWRLTDVERVKRFRKPVGHPQPVWFVPF